MTLKTLIRDIKSLIKFGVLIANVLPVIAGFWLALYFTGSTFMDYWQAFLLVTIGSTLVMAGALIINNWFDIDIDTVMERTKSRPTVTGHFSLTTVLTIGIITTIVGFILLLFTTLEATIYSFIGWFTYVFLYTMWSKRRYTLNTIVGSVSGAVTPLMGWAVVDSAFHIIPITMFMVLFIWQVPHTFATAMKKCEEYRAAGIPMLPVVYGFDVTKRQMVIYIACLLPLPFLMISLGTLFVTIITILNIAWIILGIAGLYIKDDLKWAHWNFLYSVNYLAIFFLLTMIVTI
ncbi:protoheme IX farnesyltransferase [Oceanobacillus bengalensis]|uniref:Protoheme IX farnesyltransferase n=2 Tax=Oceanobacillus bengalensis TaxID=1435466 RepID=A0A494Z590_9BACI|nr:heme o synthase [Oceanobacillus bengalensis]RKQ17644.1 protoheme IX farnesyltransferase [Oceanobacillus bengalensis]